MKFLHLVLCPWVCSSVFWYIVYGNSKPGFNSMWTVNFQMFSLDLEKAKEPQIKLPTSIGSPKKQESSRKTSTSVLLTMSKPLTVWITENCGKFLKIWEYQTTQPASWEIRMQDNKQQLELDMEQWTGSKLGKDYAQCFFQVSKQLKFKNF